MVQFDVHKRPRAQERKHPGKAKAAGQHIAQHALMAKQRGKVAKRGADVKLLTALDRQRFIDKDEDHHRGQQRGNRQDPENRMPAEPHQHRPAHHGGDQRRNGCDQHDERHHA